MKERKYSYRRNLPHIEKPGGAHFITFDTYLKWVLPPPARDLVLNHCLHDNGTKMRLLIAVVMPDHAHLIFVPLMTETNETYTFDEIVGAIKGASAHSVNKALKRSGTMWQDESFDHVIRKAESLEQRLNMSGRIRCEAVWSRSRKITNGFGRKSKSKKPGPHSRGRLCHTGAAVPPSSPLTSTPSIPCRREQRFQIQTPSAGRRDKKVAPGASWGEQ